MSGLLPCLVKNKFIITGKQTDFEELAIKTAANKLSDYREFEYHKGKNDVEILTIADLIKKNAREQHNKYIPMTYKDFLKILSKYKIEYSLDGGYINLKRAEGWLGIKKTKKQYGCPGLKRQINIKAAKCILNDFGINYEHGFDWKAFQSSDNSMYKLVNDYEYPLKRLKDK